MDINEWLQNTKKDRIWCPVSPTKDIQGQLWICSKMDLYQLGQEVDVHISNGEVEFRSRGRVTKVDEFHIWVNGIRFRYEDIDIII